MLNRDASVKVFIEKQYQRLNKWLNHIPKDIYITRFIELDNRGLNAHLRRFKFPASVYQKLTGNTVKGWSDLVGILFQPPSEAEQDIFWDEDYERESINTWLKKKYTGPYVYEGTLEHTEAAK